MAKQPFGKVAVIVVIASLAGRIIPKMIPEPYRSEINIALFGIVAVLMIAIIGWLLYYQLRIHRSDRARSE